MPSSKIDFIQQQPVSGVIENKVLKSAVKILER